MRQQNKVRAAAGNYGCAPTTRLKISNSVAKAIAEGRIPRISQLERDVGAVLTQFGVKTEAQFRFRLPTGRFGAVVDFYLPDFNAVVEVNGTFWHADPRVFPNGPTHPSQKRTLERYARKATFLQEQNIPLIEVWELDFRADPEGTVRRALTLSEGQGHTSKSMV